MKFSKHLLSLLPFLFVLLLATGQPAASLQRSVPEKEGVSSAAILQFLDAAEKSNTAFHSFMLVRHGKVIAEGWWNPYKPALLHTLYSTSKTFTATAVGFAVHEKLLSLSDKVVSFFPNQLPDTVTEKLQQLTVKDVLIMSDGQEPDPTYKIGLDADWVKVFLATPIKYEPGTKFLYNTLGTYMLSAMVQKVSGQPILEYLKPRLFTPLGITGMDWESDSKGTNTGGWGLRLKTEDLAKMAQLFLQDGKWQNKQVLPEGWAKEASSMKIMQDPAAPQSKKDSSDWLQGYCYQMWRCRNNAYRGDGTFGQFMIVMPDQDAVLAITAETKVMQEEIDLVWKYLLPAFKTAPLPDAKAEQASLKTRLQQLALKPAKKTTVQPVEKIAGKKFVFDSNEAGITSISFTADKNIYAAEVVMTDVSYPLRFGDGQWIEGITNKPPPSLIGDAVKKKGILNIAHLLPAKVTGSYSWKDEHTLQLVLQYIEGAHADIFTCRFSGSQLSMDVERSFDFGARKKTLTGKAE